MTDWFIRLQKAKKTCIKQRDLKKVRYELEQGQVMVEEYNIQTGVLTRRAWKRLGTLADEEAWDIEIGDPDPTFLNKEECSIKESSGQPCITRRNTRKILEWRIRNLPYPIEIYSVKVDPDEQCLVVRTSNKKYFKKLPVPDLARLGISLDESNVSFTHKFNTLIIVYEKPKQLLEFEKSLYEEIKKIEPKDEGDMPDCRPS
ncbi:protein DPCD [Diabrotica virgifera virgifera]|uniref:Protein DPCD n=1 Tax=Diabrotica virgifera virgifera TaxID=50390 RepID=A0A6P7F6L9_DIAVI|nr:protein DPCD [Diabrotica virgifera virgifera]